MIAAEAGLSRAERRAGRRAVRRGEAVDDSAVARLAVAYARMTLRRRPSRGLVAFIALYVVALAGFAVVVSARGRPVLGLFLAASTGLGVWALVRLRRDPAAARAAERLNRAALERAGQRYDGSPEGAEPVEPSIAGVAAAAAAVWVFYDLVYGGLTDALSDDSLDPGDAVARGALFATAMTIINLTFMRRRTKRQSRRDPFAPDEHADRR